MSALIVRTSWLGLALTACGSTAPPTPIPTGATFMVEVISATGATAVVQSSSLRANGRILFSTEPWPEVGTRSYTVTSTVGGQLRAQTALQPFICASGFDFAGRLARGERAREVHQVYLTAAGDLLVDTDIDHPLVYGCHWVSGPRSGGTDETISSRPPSCADAERMNTHLAMEGMIAGRVIAGRGPQLCWATLTSGSGSKLILQFDLTEGGFTTAALLRHCLGAGETYPLTLQLPPTTPCDLEAVVVSGTENGADRTRLFGTAGRWTIDSASLESEFRTTGSISMVFQNEAGDHLRIEGTVDLPVLRTH